MIELKREDLNIVEPICMESREVLVRAAVEGRMGHVWVPKMEKPPFCLINLGDFAYVRGITPKSGCALDLKEQIYESCGHTFLTPENELWADWIEDTFLGDFRQVTRYALKKDEQHFDTDTLERYVKQVPDGIKIKQIDEKLYKKALKEEWSRDFCSNFEDAEHFIKDGLGFAAVQGRELVSGCSAYGISSGMLEIEVGTRPDYRRQGLALACSAALVLECLKRGIYPNWDAANAKSVMLAEKLGYVFDKEYTVYQLINGLKD